MSYTRLGDIPNGMFLRQKRQRKKGGSKNVFVIGVDYSLLQENKESITRTFVSMGGELNSPQSFVFTKRPLAEKTWSWFVLTYS